MPGALATLASLLWGSSDFFGGLATKGWSVERVGIVMQSVSVAIVASVLVVFPAEPSGAALGWGAIAGGATALGIAFLYRALAIGPMHVVAPATAVVGAIVNVALGLIGGERPEPATLAGVGLALVAVGLIGAAAPTADGPDASVRRVLPMAAVAGVALGVLNACFAATDASSGVWPVATSRVVALSLLGVVAFLRAPGSAPPRGAAVRWAVAAGVADVGATTSIALALQRGSLVLVSVLGSLFPAVTVVLARLFLAERMGRAQLVGVACAVVAVAMMAMG